MKSLELGRRRAGQSLVEFALLIPLIFILIVNVVNFAGFFYAFISVGNATRAAGDYTIMGSISYSGTDPSGSAGPTLSAPSDGGLAGTQLVANMLGSDLLALRNRSSVSVRVCELSPGGTATCNVCNNSAGTGTMSCASGSGAFTSNPAADSSTGEGLNYTMTWVDVSYNFVPFIPVGFQFPGLGFGITLPNNLVIHRQSVYRVLN